MIFFQRSHGTEIYLSSKAGIQEKSRRAEKVLSFCRTPSAPSGIIFQSDILFNEKHGRFPVG